MDFKDYLFPFNEVRKFQEDLIMLINANLNEKKHLVVNAPTGLGKTVSALGPALKHAIENNLTVFFITPRHSQHKIAIETLNLIKQKFNLKFNAVDMIGKKWLCSVENADQMYPRQFYEFCNSQRDEEKCAYFKKTRKKDNKLTPEAEVVLDELKQKAFHTQELCTICKKKELCSYEVSCALAQKANVIVADYHHLLNTHIRELFLKRTNKDLSDCIIIIDEGHNVPDRV
ncbi:DEAD/DEAH box helicase family protein, partial [Candidatus Woesearchaeota archaeon]|nr:DEAD/DEAH box helicase family protein [Candidatus Woesearchaeota archaeon]